MELNNLLKGNTRGRKWERRKGAGGLEGPVPGEALLRPQGGSGHHRLSTGEPFGWAAETATVSQLLCLQGGCSELKNANQGP